MQTATQTLQLRSSAFGHGQPIPRRYTADGEDISPPLTWGTLPQGTRELALIMDDPDAPRPQPWVHWVLYRLSQAVLELPEGVPPKERLLEPADALHGRNSFDNIGYGGPAPPRGHGVHHYHFRLYALDAPLKLGPGADKDELLKAMDGHVIATGELVGTYQR